MLAFMLAFMHASKQMNAHTFSCTRAFDRARALSLSLFLSHTHSLALFLSLSLT